MVRQPKLKPVLRAILLAACWLVLPVQNALASGVERPALAYPADPTADIPWTGGTSSVADVQSAFNAARAAENRQLGTSLPMLSLPSQSEWNAMSDADKGLWLINRERSDRGLAPLHGLETNVQSVAQGYADYMLDHNAWGHNTDGRTPWERLEAQPAISACHDFLPIAENIAVFVSSGSGISLPVERSIYMWMYEDKDCCGWGHRHAILWTPYTDNGGPSGREGFLGFGRASGGPYQGPFSQAWPNAELLVMNVFDPCASWDYDFNVTVHVGGSLKGSYNLGAGETARESYPGVDSGPLVVRHVDGQILVAALRDVWTPPGQSAATSYAQLMGLPASLLSDTYYFPAYNNSTLDEQLRFGNVGSADTTVTVTIGGVVRGNYLLHPGDQKRVNYNGLDSGPVIVRSSGGVKITAAIRDAWYSNGAITSFVQMMGLPAGQLSDAYYFPSYNNVNLDEQIRFGNVGGSPTTVTVIIGGVERGSYVLQPNEQKRVNYAGLDSGPVVVRSNNGVKIIAAIRDAWYTYGTITSFSQLMGLPAGSLSSRYLFPIYTNGPVDEQLRFGNVGSADTTVTVTIGGVVRGSYFLRPGEQYRVNYPNLDAGPVIVESSGGVPIIAAFRDAWTPPGQYAITSFIQMMGLPAAQLSDSYYFPAYNNVTLSEQLRLGLP